MPVEKRGLDSKAVCKGRKDMNTDSDDFVIMSEYENGAQRVLKVLDKR